MDIFIKISNDHHRIEIPDRTFSSLDELREFLETLPNIVYWKSLNDNALVIIEDWCPGQQVPGTVLLYDHLWGGVELSHVYTREGLIKAMQQIVACNTGPRPTLDRSWTEFYQALQSMGVEPEPIIQDKVKDMAEFWSMLERRRDGAPIDLRYVDVLIQAFQQLPQTRLIG